MSGPGDAAGRAPPRPPRRRTPLLRRLGRVGGALGALLGALLLGALVFLLWVGGTDAGNRWLLDELLTLAAPPAGRIEVDGLRTRLLGGASLDGVRVYDRSGHELYGADHLDVRWRLGGLAGGKLVLSSVTAEGLRVDLADGATCFDPAGPWDDGTPSAPSGPWTGIGLDLDVHDIDLDVRRVELCGGDPPPTLSDLRVTGELSFTGPVVELTAKADGRMETPYDEPVALSVEGRWDGTDAELRALRAKLGTSHLEAEGRATDLEGAGALTVKVHDTTVDPATYGVEGVTGPVTLEAELGGRLTAPTLTGTLGTPGGPVALTLGLDTSAEPWTWTGHVGVEGFAVHQLVPATPETVVTGTVDLRGRGTEWPAGVSAEGEVALSAPVAGGQTGPFTAAGPLRLAGGVVEADGLRLGAPGGAATVAASVDLVGGTARLTVGGLDYDLARLADFGVPGLVGTVHFLGSVEAGWTGTTSARFAGTLSGTGVGYGADVRLGRVTGPVHGGWDGARATLVGALAVGELRAAGVEASGARLALDVSTRADGVWGTVSVGVDGPGYEAWRWDAAELEAELRGPELSTRARLERGGADWLSTAGTVRLEPLDVTLDELRLSPGDGPPWTAEGPVRVPLRDGGVKGLELALTSGQSRVAVSGDAGAEGPLDLVVDVSALALSRAAALYPGPLDGMGGVVDLHAVLGGTAAAPALSADLSLRGLEVPDQVRGLDLVLTARPDGRGLALRGTARSGPDEQGGRLVDVEGHLPLALAAPVRGFDPADTWALSLVVPPGGLARFARALPALGAPPAGAEPRFSAELRLSGPTLDPDLALVASATVPPGDGTPALQLDLDARSEDGLLSLRSVVRDRLQERAQVSGTVRVALDVMARAWLAGGPPVDFDHPERLVRELAVNVVPLQLPVEAFWGGAGAPPARGKLVGGVQLSGEITAPRLAGAISLVGGEVGGVTVQSSLLTLTPFLDGGYNVSLDATVEDGGFSVHGLVPVKAELGQDFGAQFDRDGLALVIEADGPGRGVPLAMLGAFLPGFRDASGRVELSGTVTGSLRDPLPELYVTVDGGAFSLRDTAVAYRDIQLSGSMADGAVRIPRLSFYTDPLNGPERGLAASPRPNVRLTGFQLGLDGLVPTTMAGHVELEQARLSNLGPRRLRASGALELSGTWPDALLVKGTVDVDSGHVELPESFFTGVNELSLDPDIEVLRGEASVTAEQTLPLPLPDVDLQIALSRSLDVDVSMPTEQVTGDLGAGLSTVRVDAGLDGDVRFRMRDEVIQLVGDVEPLRGSVTVLGKAFTIDEGTSQVIRFAGAEYDNPSLDLTARHEAKLAGGAANVVAHITGFADDPHIELSCEEYPSLDDIVAILLFGAPMAELGVESGGGSLVALVLAGLKSEVQGAGSSAALDVFDLDLTVGTTRVGKRIGRDVLLVVTLSPFANDVDEDRLSVTLEIQLPQRWLMEIETGTTGEASVSALRRWRF